LQFIINEKADIQKMFNNIILNSSGDIPDSVLYETIDQSSSHSPFIRDLITNPLEEWLQPKYNEGKWQFTVNRTDTVLTSPNNNYAVSSKMSGKWMRVTLRFTNPSNIFIKSIISELTPSKR